MALWHHKLLILQAKDVHGMSEPKLPNHLDPECAKAIQARTQLNGGAFSDGAQTLSWIWRGVPMGPEGAARYDEGLSVSGPLCHLVCSLQTECYSAEDTLYQNLMPEGKPYPSL